MIALEPASTPACPDDRTRPDYFLFDEGDSSNPPFCARTIEILTALNDVFDGLVPAEGGVLVATSA